MVLPTLRPKKLNNRSRKPGRPAKVGPALSKSPVRNLREVDPEYVETGEEQEDVPVLNWTDRLDRSLPYVSLAATWLHTTGPVVGRLGKSWSVGAGGASGVFPTFGAL